MKFDVHKLKELNELDFEQIAIWPSEIRIVVALFVALIVVTRLFLFIVVTRLFLFIVVTRLFLFIVFVITFIGSPFHLKLTSLTP